MTLPGLVHQTAAELKTLLPGFSIFCSDSVTNDATKYKPLPRDLTRDSAFFDSSKLATARQIAVISYSYANMTWGMTACYQKYPHLSPQAQEERDAVEQGRDANFRDIAKGEEEIPEEWLKQLGALIGAGLWLTGVLDEVQEGMRNLSAYYYTALWMKPQYVFLMSGFPMLRGIRDLYTYMRLIETDEFRHLSVHGDPERGYKPEKDPYLLDDNDPAAVYCASAYCFHKWVISSTLDKAEKGRIAQKALQRFFIRRDYQSSLTVVEKGRTRKDKTHATTIGDTLPALHQFRLDCPFPPSAMKLYQVEIARWKFRQRVKAESLGGSEDSIAPNGRWLLAAEVLSICPLFGYIHIDKGKEPGNPFHKIGGRDRDSIFCPLSKLYKDMPAPR